MAKAPDRKRAVKYLACGAMPITVISAMAFATSSPLRPRGAPSRRVGGLPRDCPARGRASPQARWHQSRRGNGHRSDAALSGLQGRRSPDDVAIRPAADSIRLDAMAEHARRPQAARVQCKAASVAQICRRLIGAIQVTRADGSKAATAKRSKARHREVA